LIAVVGLSFGQTAWSKPKVTETITYYEISGDTAAELRAQMKTKGPNGYWGYSRWYVRWSGSCKLSVTVDITMPKLKNPENVPAGLVQKFDKMYAALLTHEKNHGQHGISAAEEIEANRCKNGNAIIDKWAAEDVTYDKRTNHGETEGVVLR